MTEFHKSQYAEGGVQRDQGDAKRGVEKNMRGVIGIGKGSCKSKSAV